MTAVPTVLLVMAKAPQPGSVKTRLCPPATPVQAARIAAAALLDTLDTVRAVPGGQPVVALSGDSADAVGYEELAAALRGIPVIRQRGDSLGERIAAAQAGTAALFPRSPVLQIGMDTPQAGAGMLAWCLRLLGVTGTDAVLAPATDGGWWALGLRDPEQARAIIPVPTSRPDTGSRTATALRNAGLNLTAGPRLSDVDTMGDAIRVATEAAGTRFAAAVREVALIGKERP